MNYSPPDSLAGPLLLIAHKHGKAGAEARALARAVERHSDRHIDDAELLAWKSNRGMWSARLLATKAGRLAFLAFARDIIAVVKAPVETTIDYVI